MHLQRKERATPALAQQLGLTVGGTVFHTLIVHRENGVPLQCDEPKDFMTFRIGLFGLDKWHQPERSVKHLAKALETLGYTRKAA